MLSGSDEGQVIRRRRRKGKKRGEKETVKHLAWHTQHTHKYILKYTQIHTSTYRDSLKHEQTHTNTQMWWFSCEILAWWCTNANFHVYTRMHERQRPRIHTRIHMHTHTRTQTHTHTHHTDTTDWEKLGGMASGMAVYLTVVGDRLLHIFNAISNSDWERHCQVKVQQTTLTFRLNLNFRFSDL